MEIQGAHDWVGSLIDHRLARMAQLTSNLPSWGGNIDGEVAIYVTAIKNMIAANVHWSFHTQRYFGKVDSEVQKSRIVDLMVAPPYMRRGYERI